jgi:hypothetical protein
MGDSIAAGALKADFYRMTHDATASATPPWAAIIPEDQWRVYKEAIHAAHRSGARVLVGGAFGLATYINHCRNTKDLDFFVLPSDKDRVVDALNKIGFDDYYSKLPYDRGWIYRATRDDVIVDTIWQTPNRRSVVDDFWFEKSTPLLLKGEVLRAIPAEELLCIKLFVLQRDRCDWPDLLNLLYSVGARLDWEHVLRRMGSDQPLLGALLHVFNWLVPGRARELPQLVRERFCLPPITAEDMSCDPKIRTDILDCRQWFAAFQPADQPLAV